MSDPFDPIGLQTIRLLCPWDFPGKNTSVGCISFPGDFPNPGIKPECPALAEFFTAEPLMEALFYYLF